MLCSSLTTVTLGNSVTSIGESAFLDCTGLTSIVIPGSVTSIAKGAFSRCIGLTDIYFTGTETEWNVISKGFGTGSYTVHYNYVP
jgi:hypothetical protein